MKASYQYKALSKLDTKDGVQASYELGQAISIRILGFLAVEGFSKTIQSFERKFFLGFVVLQVLCGVFAIQRCVCHGLNKVFLEIFYRFCFC